MRILALDPGKTTGWAYLNDLNPLKIGTVKEEEYFNWLTWFVLNEPVHVLVVEDFTFRPGFKEGKWKTTEVAKMIGQAQAVAASNQIECVLQGASIKPVGYGMANMKYVKGKRGMHKEDAIAHAVYYYRTKGVKQSAENTG